MSGDGLIGVVWGRRPTYLRRFSGGGAGCTESRTELPQGSIAATLIKRSAESDILGMISGLKLGAPVDVAQRQSEVRDRSR